MNGWKRSEKNFHHQSKSRNQHVTLTPTMKCREHWNEFPHWIGGTRMSVRCQQEGFAGTEIQASAWTSIHYPYRLVDIRHLGHSHNIVVLVRLLWLYSWIYCFAKKPKVPKTRYFGHDPQNSWACCITLKTCCRKKLVAWAHQLHSHKGQLGKKPHIIYSHINVD